MAQPCCSTTDPGVDWAAQPEGASRRVQAQPDEIRVDKVLDIRRQLGEGTYSITERLDVVVERILADLF